jgi:hypothetical protein
MSEHRLAAGRNARVARLVRVAGIAALVLLAAFPATSLAASRGRLPVDRVVIADVPPGGGEDCVEDPDAQPGVGLRECPKGFDVGTLLPFVAGGVGIVLAVAVGWFLVMRRRVSRPFLADEAVGAGAGGSGAGSGSGEWWTCSSCGSTNLAESARCYSCGSWRR